MKLQNALLLVGGLAAGAVCALLAIAPTIAERGGRLPVTVPRHVGQLPMYYNHTATTGRGPRGYIDMPAAPRWDFGYGLSYTTFAVENVRLEDATIARDGATRVLADVTNTGARAGTEVVQLYVRDRVSSVTRPVKELKGFARVALRPGETQTVALDITPDRLAFYDVNMDFVVEPGDFDVMVGTSSRAEDLHTVRLQVR